MQEKNALQFSPGAKTALYRWWRQNSLENVLIELF